MNKLALWKLGAYFGFLGMVVVLVDLRILRLSWLAWWPGYDKVAHFALYGLLGRYLKQAVPRGWDWGLTLFCILAEEYSQLWLPHRTFSWFDIVYGVMGLWALTLQAPTTFNLPRLRTGRAVA